MNIHDILQMIMDYDDQMDLECHNESSARVAESCFSDNLLNLKCLLENAQISKDLIQSQSSRTYSYYLEEFQKTMKVRDTILNGMVYANGQRKTEHFTQVI